ncbi:hypothetical protein ACWENR_10600 [Micromonospora sp. NPDC004336]
MTRRRNRRAPLLQAAAISLAAVLAGAAVVRARRRAAGDATAGELPALREGAFAEAGTGGAPVHADAAGRDSRKVSSAAAAR